MVVVIVLIGSNKGGSGKTTLACNLSAALSLSGSDVCLLDADRQGSAALWHQEREASDRKPAITLVQKYGNLTETLRSLDRRFDYVLVDVAGRNSREMITAATVADVLIAPHQCSQLDLDTLSELHEQTVSVKDLNPGLQVLVYQTMASTNVQVIEKERREFAEYVSEFSEFRLLDAVGAYRKIYKDVMSEGLSVLEGNKNKSAAEEVRALEAEVFS